MQHARCFQLAEFDYREFNNYTILADHQRGHIAADVRVGGLCAHADQPAWRIWLNRIASNFTKVFETPKSRKPSGFFRFGGLTIPPW